MQKTIPKFISDIEILLSEIHSPTISDENYTISEAEIIEDNRLVVLKSKSNNKTPGYDGLTKEFYETFWEDIKDFFISWLRQGKLEDSLSVSQTQSVIKHLEKKTEIKIQKKTFFFTQYWCKNYF